MERRSLGSTGVEISCLALGCGTFGGVGSPPALIGRGLDEAGAFEAMNEAVALGITLFDTAFSYAGGASEAMIGRWLAGQAAAVRQRIRICTKVGTIVSATGARIDLSPTAITAHLCTSLKRLGLTHVDFCMSHAPDPDVPIVKTLEGFAAVIEAGQTSHIGACNVTPVQLLEALEASERHGLPRYEWVQNAYNLMNRGDEADLFAVCREHGLGLTPYSPVAGGMLAGKYGRDRAAPEGSRLSLRPDGMSLSERDFAAIDKLRRRAERRGVVPGAFALAWVMGHPQVTAPIAGPARSSDHLQFAREALKVRLDEVERDEIAAWFTGT